MVNYSRLLLGAIAPAIAVCASAQVTTSAITGRVVDESGTPVMGASVVAVHTPTGTRYTSMTNNDGRYTIQGMRTGGPYTVTVSYLGYGKRTFDKLYLELGNALPINVDLKPSDTQLGEVAITASAKPKGGAGRNFALETITSTPTIDRSIQDIVKNTPMAIQSKNGGITIAGTNNRYNSFQIDGTVANDVFGLSAGATNGAQTGSQPISMDAIQEIQVVVAPYDVRQGGFTGGGINAITKQGTNKTTGTAYTYFNNQSMYGKYNAARDYMKDPLTQQYERTYGGTLGGAIIKDKLFYFVNAEGVKETYPSTYYPGYSDTYLSASDAQAILDKYGELTGRKGLDNYNPRNIDRKAFNFLARLDWNINDKNHLSLRYQHANSYKDSWGSGSKTYYFANSGFRYNNKTNSIVAELNSHINDQLYNELRASATYVRDHRETPYDAPSVNIVSVMGADGVTRNGVYLGTEYSSGANELDQDVYSIEDNLSYYLGDHTLTFGTHNEFIKTRNLFLQGAYGEWRYATLDDFMNDNPNRFRFAYTDPDIVGSTRYAPALKGGQFGVYAQDKWTLGRNFNLTYGLRLDIPVIFNSPRTNDKFNQFAADQNLGVKVGEVPSGNVLVSPRVGFNWYTDDSHNTLLRGGVGIFSGRVPFVWLQNAFNNTAVDVKKYSISKNVPALGQYANNPVGAVTGSSAPLDVVTIDKDFKFPQVLRANLAIEQKLPGDIKMTIEGIYSKTLNNVFFENLALTKDGDVFAVPGLAGSAVPYYTVNKGGYSSIINLKNTDKGYSYAFSAMLEKTFDFGLDLMASYTFGHSKSVNDGTSSVAYSNWQYNYSKDSNGKNELGYAKFDIPNRVLIAVNYTTPRYWNNWMSTTIGLVYNGSNGGRYSLTMYDGADFNGDGAWTNNLLYIPTKDELQKMEFADVTDKKGNVTSTAAEQRELFEQWIEGDKYAKNHRGQYAERNSNQTHWEDQLDLHLAQNIFNPKGVGKLELTFDIMNFTNMLNKKWGASYGNVYNVSPIYVNKVVDNGDGTRKAVFTYNNNSNPTKADISSRWHCQVGVRLTF